ncbi:MAG: hypothetical protein K2Y71_20175 [Xanthobacteraceae bacterium]|nr:hypothetical protein [Xanthobacteraceae bacterium]
MIRLLLVVAGIVVSAPEVVFAQSVPSKAVSCLCSCGIRLTAPCGDNDCKRVCGWSGGGGGPPVSVPTYDPLPDLTRSFTAMLDQLARYSDAARRARGLPSARSVDELNTLLDQLYGGVRNDLQVSYNQAHEASGRVSRAVAEIKVVPQRIASLRNETSNLLQRAREAGARAQRVRERTAQFDRLGDALGGGRQSLEKDNHALAVDLHRYLWVAAPEGVLEQGLQKPPTRHSVPVQMELPPAKPPIYAMAGPAADSVPTSVPPEPVILPPLKGTTDQRIAQVGALATQFQHYQKELVQSQAGFEQRRPTLERLHAEQRQAAAENRAQRELLAQTEHDLAWARAVRDAVKRNFEARRRAFAERAVEYVLLKEFKERMLLPAIRDFLDANGRKAGSYSLNDKLMLEYYAGRRRLLESGGRQWAATKAFLEVQKKALGLIEGNDGMIATAAELLAQGSPEQIQRYAEQVFARLNKDSIDIIQISGPVALRPPLNRIASFALGLAPTAPTSDE